MELILKVSFCFSWRKFNTIFSYLCFETKGPNRKGVDCDGPQVLSQVRACYLGCSDWVKPWQWNLCSVLKLMPSIWKLKGKYSTEEKKIGNDLATWGQCLLGLFHQCSLGMFFSLLYAITNKLLEFWTFSYL